MSEGINDLMLLGFAPISLNKINEAIKNVYFCSKKLGQDTVKAISEGINDLMFLRLDNFFTENVDNDIDGATDNATSHEILEFEVQVIITNFHVKVLEKKLVLLFSSS